jgi:hypothetical protein
MAAVQGEEIALAIRDHQTAIEDWSYTGLARDLHPWVGIFDLEFKLRLPSYPVLKFAPLRNAYATYQAARDELGTRDNITFNSHELGRETGHILGTLCHELLHLWQAYHGRPSRGRYHNLEFRRVALSCGLVVDSRGCQSGYTDKFTQLLARYGVQFQALPNGQPVQPELRLHGLGKHVLKMKKWSCDCTNVRCATLLDATCNRCGGRFRLILS